MLKQWASLRTADEVRSALDVLVDLNWLKSVEDKSTGGRPTQRYLINAKLSAEGADAA
jgi:predicted transcriptional regulator